MNDTMQAAPSTSGNLRQRLMRAASWTLAGYAAAQVLRLGSNLILTRLLAPEMFGLMAIANVVIMGLSMFSDVGLGVGTIQSKRGDDPTYLNVVWVVQVARGALIAACALACAGGLAVAAAFHWLPIHSVYANPQVPALVATLSIIGLISGLESTKVWWARRHLAFADLTKIELGSQLAGTIFILTWASLSPTVWALAFGWMFSAVLTMLATHWVLPGPTNRIQWEKEAFREIFDFGKWTFLSSSLTFLLTNGDRLLLGGLLDAKTLGLYSIAFLLVNALQAAVVRLVGYAVMPALSEVVRERPEQLKQTLYQVRRPLDVVCLIASGALVMLGSQVVQFLYDPRYAAAGLILSILALTLADTRLGVFDQCLLALGKPKVLTALNVMRVLALYVIVPLGYALFGVTGAVAGVAASALVNSVFVLTLQHRLHLLDAKREALALPLFAAGLALGWVGVQALHLMGR